MVKKKNAKVVSELLSQFMVNHKLTLSDVNRAMVILVNPELDYALLDKKEKKPVSMELAEACST